MNALDLYALPRSLAVVPAACLAALLSAGCTAKGGDTAEPVDTSPQNDTEDDFSCPTPEVHVTGNDPARVGDSWDVFLWCGDTLMTGAMHMSIDPPTMGTVDDYHLTFNEAGTGLLEVQVGSLKADRTVEVTE